MKEETPDIRYEIVLCWEFFVWINEILCISIFLME